ncbi:MAG: hypothetical protein WKG07_43610 [Hymenobacter sp.]
MRVGQIRREADLPPNTELPVADFERYFAQLLTLTTPGGPCARHVPACADESSRVASIMEQTRAD